MQRNGSPSNVHSVVVVLNVISLNKRQGILSRVLGFGCGRARDIDSDAQLYA
jgi:hypothetical protein